MPWSVTLNGTTYTDEDFSGLNYVTSFFDLLSDLAAHVAGAWVGTSSSSMTIGTGSKSLVISGAGFAAGSPVRIADAAAPTTNYMDGVLTAYTASTGAATVTVDAATGSGTLTSWTVIAARSETTVASPPLGIADGGTGGTTAATAVSNLGLTRTRYAAWGRKIAGETGGGAGPTYGIVGTGGNTGSWSSATVGQWAIWSGSAWSFETPANGDIAFLEYDDELPNSADGTSLGGQISIVYISGSWYYAAPIYDRLTANSGTTAISVGSGALAAPKGSTIDVTKGGTSAATHTLPTTASEGTVVLIRNTGTSNDITVNVASSGTVNGAASITITPGDMRACYLVSNGKWKALG